MIVKPLSAVMARPVSHSVSPVATLALAALLLAAPLGAAHAQASAPAAATTPAPTSAPIPPDPGKPRDFEAERKAIGDSRAWTNYRFAVAERACYSKFLVTNCIENAKDVQREELHVLRAKDLEIGDAERAYKAATRDREQALRRAEYEAGQPGRAANEQASRDAFDRKQQEQALRDAQANGQAPQRAANAQSYQKKQDDFSTRMQEAQQKGAESARQRQENVKTYEQKQADAAQRQKDLEERRAKAEEKQKQGGQNAAPSPFGF
ncbi:hypothetical protein [Cupriavidus pauculus]|uniref:Colicin transporter n=1 Tax=Cupriavidus pauculus TaxID=82633 RepID=A0A2N5CCG4_9BURK|nr:hypothetical protein [Cupriavidus pauculus]PLP99942.1 hypothetical protein CYJ10_12965 [Cupriavidus pauculus]